MRKVNHPTTKMLLQSSCTQRTLRRSSTSSASTSSSVLRKGAWTKEEDSLLRNCITKYGEGKWHQVPARAGLNRCRKSCRLRWLNYLKPDIKRGDFNSDEVDLMIRLHKLLGNRWSLIAGRLPGRTANDVKNYWNTHMLKKMVARSEPKESRPPPPDYHNINRRKNIISRLTKTSNNNVLVKPRPRAFSKNLNNDVHGIINGKETTRNIEEDSGKDSPPSPAPNSSPQTEKDNSNNTTTIQYWLDNLFPDKDHVVATPEGAATSWSSLGEGSGSGSVEDDMTAGLFSGGDISELQGLKDGADFNREAAGLLGSSFFSFDSEFWNFLLSDAQ